MIHALTIDVEDAYSILARDWAGTEMAPTQAVVRSTRRIMELISQHEAHATFFILGEVAQAYPQLIRDIASAGHEIGVHGFYHRQVFKLSSEQFRQEITDARKLLQDLSGQAVAGHRAPAFSIRPDTKWALDVLAEEGFRYDSSIYPVAMSGRYGWPGFPLDIHRVALEDGRSIIEAPMSVFSVLSRRLPCCGGGYLRMLPWWYNAMAFRHVQRRRPVIVYLHPYEIDTDPPPEGLEQMMARMGDPARKAYKLSLRGRAGVETKLQRLLKHHSFTNLAAVIDGQLKP